MKTKDIMTRHPLTVHPDERPEGLARLLTVARVHHMPLVDDKGLVGMWLSTDEGPIALLRPETIHQTTPEADAFETVTAVLTNKEAAVVWDGDRIEGIVTRSDALRVIREAFAQDVGRRASHPIVVRLVGPAGAGKTTLLLRTLPLLRECEAGIIQTNPVDEADMSHIRGTHVVVDPHAHWRKGFRSAVEALGEIQIILMEDRDGPLEADRGVGESFQVLVVPAADADAIPSASLSEAQALVVTKTDELPPASDLAGVIQSVRTEHPHLEVIPVAITVDDRGIEQWKQWIESHILSCLH